MIFSLELGWDAVRQQGKPVLQLAYVSCALIGYICIQRPKNGKKHPKTLGFVPFCSAKTNCIYCQLFSQNYGHFWHFYV